MTNTVLASKPRRRRRRRRCCCGGDDDSDSSSDPTAFLRILLLLLLLLLVVCSVFGFDRLFPATPINRLGLRNVVTAWCPSTHSFSSPVAAASRRQQQRRPSSLFGITSSPRPPLLSATATEVAVLFSSSLLSSSSSSFNEEAEGIVSLIEINNNNNSNNTQTNNTNCNRRRLLTQSWCGVTAILLASSSSKSSDRAAAAETIGKDPDCEDRTCLGVWDGLFADCPHETNTNPLGQFLPGLPGGGAGCASSQDDVPGVFSEPWDYSETASSSSTTTPDEYPVQMQRLRRTLEHVSANRGDQCTILIEQDRYLRVLFRDGTSSEQSIGEFYFTPNDILYTCYTYY